MKKNTLLLLLLLLVLNLFSQKETHPKTKIILDLSNIIKKEKWSDEKQMEALLFLKEDYNSCFPNAAYFVSINKITSDSIFDKATNAIKIEEMWYKRNATGCCLGDVEICKVWGLGVKVGMKRKNDPSFSYFIEVKNAKLVAITIYDFFQKKEKNTPSISQKIYIEKSNDEVYKVFLNRLHEEYGKENIIEITHRNSFRFEKQKQTQVIYLLSIPAKQLVFYFVDTESKIILRTEQLDQ